jgi:hypothetical protein
MNLTLLCAVLAIPIQSDGWVAAGGRGGFVAVGRAPCWHAGWGCGGVSTGTAIAAGAAGLVAGAAIGSAVASSYQPTYVVTPPPVVVAPATPVVVAAPPAAAPPLGTVFYSLPYGAQPMTIAGQQYYYLNGGYFRPYFGGNGVYYQVVPAPY